MPLPAKVRIVDVGPRDGLQNEPTTVPTATKIELVNRLAEAGLPAVEAGAFVSPKWVPQMADSAAVLAGIRRKPGVPFSRLKRLRQLRKPGSCPPEPNRCSTQNTGFGTVSMTGTTPTSRQGS